MSSAHCGINPKKYDKYRAKPTPGIILRALAQAGITYDGKWHGTPGGQPPTIAMPGAGTGLWIDAALEIDPNIQIIAFESREPMLPELNKKFQNKGNVQIFSDDLRSPEGISAPEGKCDLVLFGHSHHLCLKGQGCEEGASAQGGIEPEERARQSVLCLLRDDIEHVNDRVAIIHCNPDPKNPAVQELHAILSKTQTYRNSTTPLIPHAQGMFLFDPRYMQGLMDKSDMHVSEPMDMDMQALGPEDFLGWLGSFSFAPKEAELEAIKPQLRAWFQKCEDSDRKVRLPYIAEATCGPARRGPFTGWASNREEQPPISQERGAVLSQRPAMPGAADPQVDRPISGF
jgi:hypothetical protein